MKKRLCVLVVLMLVFALTDGGTSLLAENSTDIVTRGLTNSDRGEMTSVSYCEVEEENETDDDSEDEEEEKDEPTVTDENGFVTLESDNSVMVGYVGNEKSVRIPDTIRVIRSFGGDKLYMEYIIPSTVEKIGKGAGGYYWGRGYNLGSLVFETGDLEIDPEAFDDNNIAVVAPRDSKAWKYAFDYGNYAIEKRKIGFYKNKIVVFPMYQICPFFVGKTKAIKIYSSNNMISNPNEFGSVEKDVEPVRLWYTGNVTFSTKIGNKKYKTKIVVKKRTMENVTKHVTDYVVKKNMTAFQKVEAVFGWFKANHMYGNEEAAPGKSAEYLITTGEGVCGDQAAAFKYFMDKLKIPCKLIKNHAIDHAWNLVKVGKHWYEMDITWGLFLTNKIPAHKYGNIKHPKCKSKKYNNLEEVSLFREDGVLYYRYCKIDKNGRRTFLK